jgi:hypothetical protein
MATLNTTHEYDLLADALRGDECNDDDGPEGIVSLLEENARLRGLVVKLSDIILRHVADRG